MGVDEDDDASSSEDEGVEVDLEDSDTDEPQDTRLLHQLAASLAQELKYAKQNISNTKLSHNNQNIPELCVQSMDFAPELVSQVSSSSNYPQSHSESSNPFASYSPAIFYHDDDHKTQTQSHIPRQPPPPYQYKPITYFDNRSEIYQEKNFGYGSSKFQNHTTEITPPSYASAVFNTRTRVEGVSEDRLTDPVSWGIGWDACATEAIRYLVEDEGLPLHHPTVVAMKNHLDLQRSRVVSQFAS